MADDGGGADDRVARTDLVFDDPASTRLLDEDAPRSADSNQSLGNSSVVPPSPVGLLGRARNAALLGAIVAAILALAQILTAVALEDRSGAAARQSTREVIWRQALANPDGAYMVGSDLNDLDLSSATAAVNADLREVSAHNTDFSNAQLVGVSLAGADLSGADFDGARMRGGFFNTSVLDDASLRGADLRGASFHLASVQGADFSGAFLSGVDFRGVDLSTATFTFLASEQFCFDDSTVFGGTEKPQLECETDIPFVGGLASANFGVSVATRRKGESVDDWTDSLELTPGDQVEVRVELQNKLKTINNVSVVVENRSGNLTFGVVEVVNANFPDGFEYSTEAIQAQEAQVNVDIGDYSEGSNALVYSTALFGPVGEFECGRYQFAITAYVTPDGFPSLNSSVFFVAELGC